MPYPSVTQFDTRDFEVAQRLRLREETAPYRRAARLERRRAAAEARQSLAGGLKRVLRLGPA